MFTCAKILIPHTSRAIVQSNIKVYNHQPETKSSKCQKKEKAQFAYRNTTIDSNIPYSYKSIHECFITCWRYQIYSFQYLIVHYPAGRRVIVHTIPAKCIITVITQIVALKRTYQIVIFAYLQITPCCIKYLQLHACLISVTFPCSAPCLHQNISSVWLHPLKTNILK